MQDHPNSHVITIFRAGTFLSRAQGPDIDDMFAESKVSIGSYFENNNSNKVGTGLTQAEEKLLMPTLVLVPSDDRDFRKLVSEFFIDINTPVPYSTGINLEIGLEISNDKELSKDNMPINVMDFVRWRHAKSHPYVAKNKDEAAGLQQKQFYIFDKLSVQQSSNKRLKATDAAMQVYLKIKEEESTVDQMLTLLGTDPRTFTGPNKRDLSIEELSRLLHADPDKFKKTYDEGDLEIRYAIKTMAATGVLNQVGNRYFMAETNSLIGNTLEETIWWFKDEENSDSVVALKARMQEALAIKPKIEKRRTVKQKA